MQGNIGSCRYYYKHLSNLATQPLRSRFYSVSLIWKMLINRWRAIVDKSFHKVRESLVCANQFRAVEQNEDLELRVMRVIHTCEGPSLREGSEDREKVKSLRL
jgi:hypothetical protein